MPLKQLSNLYHHSTTLQTNLMPLIEELPNTGATAAPGWAYVADTGYDPSKVAINPSGTRNRAARNGPAVSGSELSARQQKVIDQRLAELHKDGPKVAIILPESKRAKSKPTPNVKKILLSNKTFQNHVEDEEALLVLNRSQPVPRAPAPGKIPKTPASKAKRASIGGATPSTPLPATPTGSMPPPPLPATIIIPQPFTRSAESPLQTLVPDLPPPAEIEVLLSAPPLAYTAAQAGPPAEKGARRPQRHFCEICGYWGRVKCLKCAARTCGLECSRTHEESRCNKFYA
ncbi:hypothetical protein M501DRAFT_301380 [Patellaria atrata CBS 101060]|uniref:HIT-type domain-containing protein n=1 Tax=Patellaria atrata CBS 101060 TaxID=1346257 RepID=A0A9P4S4T7_9PEZI|nr:hypothetical protein M501DRAFT_301380 [Patellaria atrata CBS 101060]